MSTRAQVKLVYIDHIIEGTENKHPEIYLYKHHDGYEIPAVVANALTRGIKADLDTDPEALAQIIWHYISAGDTIGNHMEFEIGVIQYSDINVLVEIGLSSDKNKEYVHAQHIGYKEIETIFEGTYDEFIDFMIEHIKTTQHTWI